jgi:hypothetical protein
MQIYVLIIIKSPPKKMAIFARQQMSADFPWLKPLLHKGF